jgi:hypothetical protein
MKLNSTEEQRTDQSSTHVQLSSRECQRGVSTAPACHASMCALRPPPEFELHVRGGSISVGFPVSVSVSVSVDIVTVSVTVIFYCVGDGFGVGELTSSVVGGVEGAKKLKLRRIVMSGANVSDEKMIVPPAAEPCRVFRVTGNATR